MPMDLELVSFKLCPFVQRAVIVLLRKQAPYRVSYIDLGAPPDRFLALSPRRKVPLLLVDGRHVIFESAVINEFIDEVTPGSLHPEAPLARARNRAWVVFGDDALMETRHMTTAADEAAFCKHVARLEAKLAELEAVLGDGPFFNGADFSLVDAAYAPLFLRLELLGRLAPVFDAPKLPRIAKWSRRLLNQPEIVNSVVDDFEPRLADLVRRRQGFLAGLLADSGSAPTAGPSDY